MAQPYKRFALILSLALSTAAYAQTAPGVPVATPQGADTRPKINSVKERDAITSSHSRLARLESMYGSDIAPSWENIEHLGSIAESSPNLEEKIAATRLLGNLHITESTPEINSAIRTRLRPLSQHADKRVATAALLRYTRLGYFSDTEALLDFNLNRGFLSKDDVGGELAHILVFAPATDQPRIIDKIDKDGSEYALDIVASNLKHEGSRKRLSAQAKGKVLASLLKHQPRFSTAIGEFSLKEAIVYSDWLHTIATLKSEVSNEKYDDVIMSQIGGDFSNPKRAISFLASPEGRIAAARLGSTRLASVFQRVSDYAKRLPYPQNSAALDYSNMVLALKGSIKP